MRKHLLLFLMMMLPMVASADAVEIDGIYYNLVTKAKVAVITTNPNKYSGSVIIPETITFEGVEYAVTSIGDNAFYYCQELTSISIPPSITSIGTSAFGYCENLQKVIINDIAAWCRIHFKVYDSNPLYYQAHLYSNNNTEIKDLKIPSSITTINDYTFNGCIGLTSVTFEGDITSIGEHAFEFCWNLTSINFPLSLTYIGQSAFLGCRSLSSINIPYGITKIEESAFRGCSSLTSVILPQSVTSIGKYSFSMCSNLSSIKIPNGVIDIGFGAFSECSGLISIIIPNSVTSIGRVAFSDCHEMVSVIIGNGVSTIVESTFAGCEKLTTLTIGKNVNCIGDNNFKNCYELADVFIFSLDVPTSSSNTFDGSYIEYATLHVPASSISLYQTAEPWSSFGTIKVIEYESPGNENGDGYWSTYYNSMGNFEADDNTKVYTASLDELQEKLVLTEVTDKIIKAGQGVILKSTNANANLTYTSAEGTEGFYTNNALKGFDEATTTTAVEGTIYVLGENSSKELGFYKYSGTTLNANKAYLEINASSARQFYSIDDNTTDISRIMNAPKTTEQIFNLQGQQVAHPSKGAYIVNGHKVIIK